MPTASNQEIITAVLSNEVETIRGTYNLPNRSKINFFMVLEPGPGDTIILVGYFQIKGTANDNKDSIYVQSAAIDHQTLGVITVPEPYLKTPIWIKKQELDDILNSGNNIILTPFLANSISPVKHLYYQADDYTFDLGGVKKVVPAQYFPSPPATGNFS